MKVTIKGKEIELKYSIRALMMYENIADKTFQPTNLTDMITFCYCIVLSSSGDYSLGLDDFIDEIDNDPKMLEKFNEWLISTVDNQNKLKKD